MKAIKTIIVFSVAVFLLLACGGGGGGSSTIPQPEHTCFNAPVYGTLIFKWTFKGDSMAYLLADEWDDVTNVENDGMCGATIETYSEYPDMRILKNVVLFIGVNNFRSNPNADLNQILIDYANLFHSIKGITYCVGTPHYTDGYNPLTVEFNEGVKNICGENYYVDTWSLPFTSDDGLHPDAAMNALIKAKILEMEVTQ